jgi:4-hydroxy-3-polyprenylbenzoate decarboxylase
MPRTSSSSAPQPGIVGRPARRVVLGVTGASGALYARRLLDRLVRARVEVCLTVSPAGALVVSDELDIRVDWLNPGDAVKAILGRTDRRVTYYPFDRLEAPIASGSYPADAMVVIPCSASTLGAIASGVTLNLLHRAADVTLKERRPLILVLRETPLSVIHIENMGRAARAGALILPAMPSFYSKPKTVADLIDSVVSRVLDHLGVPHRTGGRYAGR